MLSFVGGFSIFILILSLFILITLLRSTYLVRQSEVIIIERLGKYKEILKSGIHFVVPFIDQPRKVLWSFVKEDPSGRHVYRYSEYIERIDLREAVYDFPKQNVITRDNVTMEINALLYYQITDPMCSAYEVANLPQAIEKLTQTTLRNVIGSMDLDECLSSRDKINEKLREHLDEASNKWGLKVNRVELQDLNPPVDIRLAMEKQMKAERDRRAMILEAEGMKSSAILQSEGEKFSKITRAQGEAESRLINAKAEAESRLITTKAEAESISMIQKAVPNGDPLPYLVALNYIKALPEIMKDKDGKMILVPYEASALMGSISTIKELFVNKK